jgi:hypothetical protein
MPHQMAPTSTMTSAVQRALESAVAIDQGEVHGEG